MKRFQFLARLLVLVSIALPCCRASAFFHFWDFAEFYSNASGTVQFIELQNTPSGENFATGVQIRSSSTGNIFTFDDDLDGSTANKRLLVATSNFASQPGAVTPDFTFATPTFFNPAGDTIALCNAPCTAQTFTIFDTRTVSSVPTDSVLSRIYPSNTLFGNTPTNFAIGASGSVNRGDYNANGVVEAGDYVVWRKTLTQAASPAGSGADGNNSGLIDAGDHTVWKSRFANLIVAGSGAGQSTGVPEPTAIALALVGLAAFSFCLRRRLARLGA